MRLLFHLGRHPELSIAEIARLFAVHGIKANGVHRSGAALTVDVHRIDDCLSWCRELGGTIRVGMELSRLDSAEPQAMLDAWLAADDLDDVPPGRCCIGWSFLSDPIGEKNEEDPPTSKGVRRSIRTLGELTKESLSKQGRSVRFLLPREDSDVPWLTSAQAGEAKLLKQGRDLLVAWDSQGLGLYRTVWLQDYEAQSVRDYQRPHRDTYSGLLPPQLARIMVNLARDPNDMRILDPFCGEGGLLAEAFLLGMSVIGSDKEFEAVRHARNNIKWLARKQGKKSQPDESGPTETWIQSDVRTLRRVLPPLDLPAVATEPFLGPPQRGTVSEKNAESTIDELTDLYVEALAEIRMLVKPGARVVFLVPSIQVRDRDTRLVPPLAREVDLLGYRKIDPFEGIGLTPPKHLEYARPGQTVGRRVLLLSA